MAGDARRRFCTHCNKFVHNLTEMPAEEAERLVCESGGELCVRFARDPHTNRILTLNYRPPPKPNRRRAIATLAAIFAAISFSSTYALCKLLRKAPPTPPAPTLPASPPVMSYVAGGAFCPPPPPTIPPKSRGSQQGKPARPSHRS
jgi:hypothetical protein